MNVLPLSCLQWEWAVGFGTEPEDSAARGLLYSNQKSESWELIVLTQPTKDFQNTVLRINWLGLCLKNSPDLGTSYKFCARALKLHLGMKTLTSNGRRTFAVIVSLRCKNQRQKWIPWSVLDILTILQTIHAEVLDGTSTHALLQSTLIVLVP